MVVSVPAEFELLEAFPATKKLRELGFTDEQLTSSRFSRKYLGYPFDEWPFTWPDDAPVEGNPMSLIHLKSYLAYRHALIDGPKLGGLPMIQGRMNHLAVQSANAQKKRGFLPELGMSMKDFIPQFCRRPEFREQTAKQIWPHLFSELNIRGLDPEEQEDGSYTYSFKDGTKSISFLMARFGF
jgi:hypothetical protein